MNQSLEYIKMMKRYSRYNHIKRASRLKIPVTLIVSSNTFRQVDRTAAGLFNAIDNARFIRLSARNHFIFR